MIQQLGLFLRTVKYIKPIQVLYQIKNRIAKPKTLLYYKQRQVSKVLRLKLVSAPSMKSTAEENQKFTFLNLSKKFNADIHWNYNEYGKLWNYNLQYCAFINEEHISEKIRVSWVEDLFTSLYSGKVKLEPYPVSLRTMNLIRFLSKDEERVNHHKSIMQAIEAELTYLNDSYEYHLLGNHLLENAFAMLMGGYFFQNQSWQSKAKKVVKEQLLEQILQDGAHFELSVMYHQIILFRLVEAISYLHDDDELCAFLREKAVIMLSWLKQITFEDGSIPHFNDSSDGIAFTTAQLTDLCTLIDIKSKPIKLTDSGYRKFLSSNIESVLDVQGISPGYQPGHNHADHLSFVMNVQRKPFIVDPGTSTYAISPRRQWERSSKAHNTVTINDYDQSEVWSGFRVGRRAKVRVLKDEASNLVAVAEYDVSGLKVKHAREFSNTSNSLKIKDTLNVAQLAVARFYLHPEVIISEIANNSVSFANLATITFNNNDRITVEPYQFAEGFNKLKEAKVLEVDFRGNLESLITVS